VTAVLFRADAGLGIGHGHVFRCLTLAKVLAEYKVSVCFVCKDHPGHLAEKIVQQGFACYLLPCETGSTVDPANYHSWVGGTQENDALQTITIVEEHARKTGVDITVVVVDHYGLDKNWELPFQEFGLPVWAIDDLANRNHRIYGLIDTGIDKTPRDYETLLDSQSLICTGSDYALIRSEFLAWRESSLARKFGTPGNLLIMFGGVDHQDWTGKTLNALINNGLPHNTRVRVVIGSGYLQRARLNQKVHAAGIDLEILQDIENVAQILADTDLCIGGGGSAVWERCCLGVPTIMIQIVDNQAGNCRALEAAGAAICLPRSVDMSDLTGTVQSLLGDAGRRSEMKSIAAALVDGYGARRVASLILGATGGDGEVIFLRPVVESDCESVYRWQSQTDNRRYFRNPDVPEWSEHSAWFARHIESGAWSRIIVRHKKSVGIIRLQSRGSGYEVSILIDKEHQGQGIAQAALGLLGMEKSDVSLYAEIHNENIASVRLFEKAGFRPLNGRLYLRTPTKPGEFINHARSR